MKSIVPVI